MEEPCRLYLISPPVIDDLPIFVDHFKSAVAGGDIACFQLRLKQADGTAADDDTILAVADALLRVASAHDIAFLINDRPDLAKRSGADGVHIGQKDMALKEARALLGDEASIGVTCHNSIHLAMEAGESGADYVAFGAFFPTRTKAVSVRAEPDLLARWCAMATVPVVAIGGITAQNCAPLVAAGADFLAISGAVWHHSGGPGQAISELNEAFEAFRHK